MDPLNDERATDARTRAREQKDIRTVPDTESTGSKPLIDLVALRLLLMRHWAILAGCLAAGLAAGLVLTLVSPKMYTASASGVVVVRGSNDIGGVMTGDSIAKSKATQFQSLAKSRTVAAEALKAAGLKGSPDAAAGSVTVAVPEDTAQLNITVNRDDPADAARLANAWVTALSKSVESMADAQVAPSSAGGQSTSESVISVRPYVTAPRPSSPSSPNLMLNLLLGAILGLAAGFLWALVKTKSDRRIRGSEVIERDYGLSVVGTLPKREDEETRAFLLKALGRKVRKGDFRSVESYNELRANLQFMNPDRPPQAIVVTSALPGEGKSTVAANLAIAIAESGRSVVLVDGDLRRPTVAASLGLVGEVGVTTAIVNHGSVDECLQEVQDMPTLRVLTAGTVPPNPAEIVGSEAFAAMIEELAREAFVIIDAPPLIPVADGAIMARRFDGCLVVLDAQSATKDALNKSLSVLDKVDAAVLGVVLNRVPTGKLESSQYGYYGDEYYYYSSTQSSDSAGVSGDDTQRRRRRRDGDDGATGVGAEASAQQQVDQPRTPGSGEHTASVSEHSEVHARHARPVAASDQAGGGLTQNAPSEGDESEAPLRRRRRSWN